MNSLSLSEALRFPKKKTKNGSNLASSSLCWTIERYITSSSLFSGGEPPLLDKSRRLQSPALRCEDDDSCQQAEPLQDWTARDGETRVRAGGAPPSFFSVLFFWGFAATRPDWIHCQFQLHT